MKRGKQNQSKKSSPKHSLSLPDLDQARSYQKDVVDRLDIVARGSAILIDPARGSPMCAGMRTPQFAIGVCKALSTTITSTFPFRPSSRRPSCDCTAS